MITSTPLNTTFTPSVTGSPAPTVAPPSPPAQPTPAPVEGTTSTQVNVRADPSTAGGVLGIIPANTIVQITGKDPAANWWQILYPQGKDGRGWVTSQYVTTQNADVVPVIGGGLDQNNGTMAVVQQQINVRSGPGTGFNTLGTLNAGDAVHLTGKDANGVWLQIEFAAGLEGKGWVNAAFVQAKGLENLPIVTEAGEAIGTGTPTAIPPTPTVTVVPARDDQDSPQHPVASVVFEPLGTQTLIYSGDISAPQGDPQDWIQFTPYTDTIYASLECKGSTNILVDFLENGQASPLKFECGDRHKSMAVEAGALYTIHLRAPQFSGGLQYSPYLVRIQSGP